MNYDYYGTLIYDHGADITLTRNEMNTAGSDSDSECSYNFNSMSIRNLHCLQSAKHYQIQNIHCFANSLSHKPSSPAQRLGYLFSMPMPMECVAMFVLETGRSTNSIGTILYKNDCVT